MEIGALFSSSEPLPKFLFLTLESNLPQYRNVQAGLEQQVERGWKKRWGFVADVSFFRQIERKWQKDWLEPLDFQAVC